MPASGRHRTTVEHTASQKTGQARVGSPLADESSEPAIQDREPKRQQKPCRHSAQMGSNHAEAVNPEVGIEAWETFLTDFRPLLSLDDENFIPGRVSNFSANWLNFILEN